MIKIVLKDWAGERWIFSYFYARWIRSGIHSL